MNERPVDNRVTMQPTTRFVEVRGADGRLYGRYDPDRQLLEVRKGQQREIIDLKKLRPA